MIQTQPTPPAAILDGTAIESDASGAVVATGAAPLSPLRQLLRAALSLGVLHIASMGVTFAVGVLLARQLGPAGYGTYGLAMAVTALVGMITEFGLPLLVMREFAAAEAAGRWSNARGLIRWSNRLILGLSGVVLAGFLGAAAVFDLAGRSAFLATMVWAILLIPPVALAKLRGLALVSLGRTAAGQFPVLILRPALFALALMAAWGLHARLDPASAMLLQVAAAALAMAAVMMAFRRLAPPAFRAAVPVSEPRAWLAASVPMALTEGLRLVQGQMSIFLLGIFATAADVGHYRVADAVSLVVLVPATIINVVMAPVVTRLFAQGDHVELQRIVGLSTLLITAMVAILVLPMLLFGDVLIELAFGRAFGPSFVPLAILLLGNLLVTLLGPTVTLANMIGQERAVTIGAGVAVLVQLTVTIALIPVFGANGAAGGVVLGLLVWTGYLALVLRRRVGIGATWLSIDLRDGVASTRGLVHRLRSGRRT